jgi:phage repressor protein C with HTH and peptisase S24 domain
LTTKPEGFWQRLQEAFRGKKPPQIASELGIQKQAVYKWRDGNLPGLDTLLTIRKTTGCSLDWLLTGEGPRYIVDIDASSEGQPLFKLEPPAKLSEEDRKTLQSLLAGLSRVLDEG